MPEHKPAKSKLLLNLKKFLVHITERKNAHFIVLAFIAVVTLSFILLMIFDVWTPQKAMSGWKNQKIVRAVNDLGYNVYVARNKFNGVPSNADIKMADSKFNVVSCKGGMDNKKVLNCEGLYPGVDMPKVCLDTKDDINPDCFINVLSPADLSNGELGAGKFRVVARLYPTAIDRTGVTDVTYYVYDYKEGGFYCSGYSKFDSKDSMSKYESCRSAGR